MRKKKDGYVSLGGMGWVWRSGLGLAEWVGSGGMGGIYCGRCFVLR